MSSSFHVALSSVSWGPKNCRHTFVPRAVRSVGGFDHVRLCILWGGRCVQGELLANRVRQREILTLWDGDPWEVPKGGSNPLA